MASARCPRHRARGAANTPACAAMPRTCQRLDVLGCRRHRTWRLSPMIYEPAPLAGAIGGKVLEVLKADAAEQWMHLREAGANPRLHRRALRFRRQQAQIDAVVAKH